MLPTPDEHSAVPQTFQSICQTNFKYQQYAKGNIILHSPSFTPRFFMNAVISATGASSAGILPAAVTPNRHKTALSNKPRASPMLPT
jgi:hypothetical protein